MKRIELFHTWYKFACLGFLIIETLSGEVIRTAIGFSQNKKVLDILYQPPITNPPIYLFKIGKRKKSMIS